MSEMYGWIDNTYNPLGGVCPHDCNYCYRNEMMKFPNTESKYTGEPRLYPEQLRSNPRTKAWREGYTIFVCSMTDLFAEDVEYNHILEILTHLNRYPENTYLLQTKNPGRLIEFVDHFPPKTIIGTTIETNDMDVYNEVSKAPEPEVRQKIMSEYNTISKMRKIPKMISIEPIFDFDLDIMVEWMKQIHPDFISIGADSKSKGIPEPNGKKITNLIAELRVFTKVKVKPNLNRLMGA